MKDLIFNNVSEMLETLTAEEKRALSAAFTPLYNIARQRDKEETKAFDALCAVYDDETLTARETLKAAKAQKRVYNAAKKRAAGYADIATLMYMFTAAAFKTY